MLRTLFGFMALWFVSASFVGVVIGKMFKRMNEEALIPLPQATTSQDDNSSMAKVS